MKMNKIYGLCAVQLVGVGVQLMNRVGNISEITDCWDMILTVYFLSKNVFFCMKICGCRKNTGQGHRLKGSAK